MFRLRDGSRPRSAHHDRGKFQTWAMITWGQPPPAVRRSVSSPVFLRNLIEHPPRLRSFAPPDTRVQMSPRDQTKKKPRRLFAWGVLGSTTAGLVASPYSQWLSGVFEHS